MMEKFAEAFTLTYNCLNTGHFFFLIGTEVGEGGVCVLHMILYSINDAHSVLLSVPICMELINSFKYVQ